MNEASWGYSAPTSLFTENKVLRAPKGEPILPSAAPPPNPFMAAVVTHLQTGEGRSLLASHSQEQQVWGYRIRLLRVEDQLPSCHVDCWSWRRAREPISKEGC